MFIIESYSSAVVFCFITMLWWGSRANTQKLNSNRWRFELFYWDSLESTGDLQQASSNNLRSAFIGGIIFNAANILLSAAVAIAGMYVAFPVGIARQFPMDLVKAQQQSRPFGEFMSGKNSEALHRLSIDYSNLCGCCRWLDF